MQLPVDLANAMEVELREAAAKDVSVAVRGLSERYRAPSHSGRSPFIGTTTDALAYTAFRLPATYAATIAVLEEVGRLLPDFKPHSVLDVGAGPGTGGWAAAAVWPSLEKLTFLEVDDRMIGVGKALAHHSNSPAIRGAEWRHVDARDVGRQPNAELTIAGYMIGELSTDSMVSFLHRLWEATSDTCVLVEPGTPRGFRSIKTAEAELIASGANIVAPFPHDWQCTESDTDWCHFAQRVPRTRRHRLAKGATLSYEDEKYCYVVASRREAVPIAARVIRQPQTRSGHVRLVLCTPQGVVSFVVARSNHEAYRIAKDLRWGSAISIEDARSFNLLA
jgi:ribosomal protein RSM22 (predicted rRNA methylase)